MLVLKLRSVGIAALTGLIALFVPSCVEQPQEAATRVGTQAVETIPLDNDEVVALGELAILLDAVHAELVASLADDDPLASLEPIEPIEPPGEECDSLEPLGSGDGLSVMGPSTLSSSIVTGVQHSLLCGAPADPGAELDAQIKEAEERVADLEARLADAAMLTAPEQAEAKLRLAMAKAALGRLQVAKDLRGIAQNDPQAALKRARAAEKLAELNLMVAKAATEAAIKARDAAQQALGITVSQKMLLEAQLRVSDATLAEANAVAKAEAAKLARMAEEAKLPKP
jgi:hypothetical protein